MAPLVDTKEEARRLVRSASEGGAILRLVGGVAIALRCPSMLGANLARAYTDIDLVGHEKQFREIREFLTSSGYEPRSQFNAVMGGTRLVFDDVANKRRVDVFLDVFEMSHKLDFSSRLELEPLTLPLADLLATKLQIVEVNEKDMKDVAALLIDHEVAENDGESINGRYLAGLGSRDWGFYKTATTNLGGFQNSVDVLGLTPSQLQVSKQRSEKLSALIEGSPKGLAWRLRAGIGERVRWYQLPEPDEAMLVGSHD